MISQSFDIIAHYVSLERVHSKMVKKVSNEKEIITFLEGIREGDSEYNIKRTN